MTMLMTQSMNFEHGTSERDGLVDAARDVADILDLGRAAVVVVDAGGAVRFSNAAGERASADDRCSAPVVEVSAKYAPDELPEVVRSLGSAIYDSLGEPGAAQAVVVPTRFVLSTHDRDETLIFVCSSEADERVRATLTSAL